MALSDIYYVLFRHKWIILLCSAAGVFAALSLFVIKPPRYRSQAKLYIPYVVEGRSLNPPGSDVATRALNEPATSILNTETKFLLNLEVTRQAAIAVGPERILAKVGGGTNADQAANLILNNLEIELAADTISVTFQHPDSQIAQEVLGQVILAYVNKQKEMHQPVGLYGDFLIKETERLRSELAQTEEQLTEAKTNAGVTSLDEAKKDYTEQIAKIREQLFNAEADLAEHQAKLAALTTLAPASTETTNTGSAIPSAQIAEYRRVCALLDRLSSSEEELLTHFTTNTIFVQAAQKLIAENEAVKKKLEQDCPQLVNLAASTRPLTGQTAGSLIDPSTEAAEIRALETKTNILDSQMKQIQAEAAKADKWESTILKLQRTKEQQEADLKYFSSSLEQSRVDQALGSGKAPNIRIVQSPSLPVKEWSQSFKKKVKMVAVGGFLGGIALAFLIELVLDRSVKRPTDVTSKLRLPLFIAIPNISRNGNHRLAAANGKDPLLLADRKGDAADSRPPDGSVGMPLAAWDRSHPLRRFYEGLRDRLIVYFEVNNLTQKPKLVGVTSCGKGAGVTSIAAGLAASLSETGDGNVLLVDMNAEQGASQQFYKGKPGCGLDDALATETMQSALVQSNLYVATERVEDDKLPRVLPGRFAKLMPKLKASDYDYIIFDLPPVSQTSMTPRFARIMDMVLLIIESEKTSQDVVKQATSLLAESKANISAVLNKTRTYVPSRLHQELDA